MSVSEYDNWESVKCVNIRVIWQNEKFNNEVKVKLKELDILFMMKFDMQWKFMWTKLLKIMKRNFLIN